MTVKKAVRPKESPQNPALTEIWSRFREQPNAAEAVYQTLREAILQGELKSGHPLSEIPLAEAFGRSRTPVREAIFRLESEGLAGRLPRRGLMVALITREEILEVYAVREMLDALAARLAALGSMPSEIDRLVWLNERLRTAGAGKDHKALTQLNIDFHEAICQASRNTLLQEFVRRIHQWVRRFENTTLSAPGRAIEACAEHDALIAAIRARDPDQAERIAREHMTRAREIRIRMLQSAAEDGPLSRMIG